MEREALLVEGLMVQLVDVNEASSSPRSDEDEKRSSQPALDAPFCVPVTGTHLRNYLCLHLESFSRSIVDMGNCDTNAQPFDG